MIRRVAAVVGWCCVFTLSFSRVSFSQTTVPAESDQVAIRQAAIEFVKTYNEKDAKGLSGLFGEHARYEDAQGHVVIGREQIQQAFEAAFQADPQAQISVDISSLQSLTPDVIIEQGTTDFYPDGKTLTSRGKYMVLHLKQHDHWRMVSVRTMEEEIVCNYEALRSLEWLVGDWVDESPQAVVETHGHWDANKNFLLLDITVKRQGAEIQTGNQRIGWDPQAKEIRGWAFDSEGGFGETRWQPSAEGWRVVLTGVAKDGNSVSATRHFFLKDQDHVVVTTTDRSRGDENLPDIQITMTRKGPPPAIPTE